GVRPDWLLRRRNLLASYRRFSCADLELPVIDAGEVVHAHLAVLLVCVEELAQLIHHWRVIRMAFRGREGAAAEAAGERVPVECLVIGQVSLKENAQETVDALRFGIGV